MANEKRLIDANALCEFFRVRYEFLRNASERRLPNGYVQVDTDIQTGAIIAKEFLDKAKDAPTVDAVEVVRCKDCKYAMHDDMFGGYWCGGGRVKSDHFCSYGERRSDGE